MSVFPLTAASDCHAAVRDLIKGLLPRKLLVMLLGFLVESVTAASASAAPHR